MNFFKGVKEKLSNVGDDISKSLNIRAPRKSSSTKQITIDDCSFLGGAELLEKYQNDWSNIHEGNEGIAKTANRIDVTINTLHHFVGKRHAQYSRMAQLMGNDLPRLEADLDSICATLKSINEAVERAEVALAGLEDQIEWIELRRNETIATNAWCTARRRSANQMDVARVTRAQEHAQRVANVERQRQSHLRERAETFDEEFQRDVQHFREHGRIERAVSHASATEEDLARIDISDDVDKAALDDFLNEADPPSNVAESGSTVEALDELVEKTEDEEDTEMSGTTSPPEVQVLKSSDSAVEEQTPTYEETRTQA